jgi:ribosomal protein L32E
MEKLKFK